MTQFSDNGWPGIPNREDLAVCNIPGTDLSFRLAHGGPDWILTEFARRFNVEVESLSGPQLDDWSYANRAVRGASAGISCHASGTAIDLNALQHFRGVRNTYGEAKLRRLRTLLSKFTDPQTGVIVIKWGGDWSPPSIVDEMHFQIRGDKAALARVRERLEDVDMKWTDKVPLTAKDAAIWGNNKDGKPYREGDLVSLSEMLRYPTLARKIEHELTQLAKLVEALVAGQAKSNDT